MKPSQRHELKQDWFLAWVIRVYDQIVSHKREVIAGVVVASLLLLGILWYISHMRAAERQAWSRLENTSVAVEQTLRARPESENAAAGVDSGGGALGAALREYRALYREHPDLPVGQLALLRAGDALYAKGKWKEAAAEYRLLLSRPTYAPEILRRARRALAAAEEQLGQFAEAAEQYRQAGGETGPHLAQDLWDVGRCLEQVGRVVEAEEAYRGAVAQAPASLFGKLAAIRLQVLAMLAPERREEKAETSFPVPAERTPELPTVGPAKGVDDK